MDERVLVMPLDGDDWKLLGLMPREWEQQKVWKEDWEADKSSPAVGQWIRGTVPGDVIADALDAGLIPHPYKDLNSRACEWLSERDWLYRKDFTGPDLASGEVLRLYFEGVDYACTVYLNGELLGEHEGMFAPFEFNVTQKVRAGKQNRLVVVVQHAPSVDLVQGQIGRTSKARIWKSRFAYWWDWCTRLIPVGVYRSVTLVRTGPFWVEEVWLRPRVNNNGDAEVEARVEVGAAEGMASSAVRVEILDGDKIVASATHPVVGETDHVAEVKLSVAGAKLWWPNGMGEQHLYTVRTSVLAGSTVSDTRTERIGMRNLRMVQNEGAKDALPYTMEVNGERLWIRGWNWVPMDHMYGRDHGDNPPAQHPVQNRYERALNLAAHAHCNLLRVWGGGLQESRKFYDLCDSLGILVWQEFPQSSSGIDNRPPEDEAYLTYIEERAREIIPQRRNHACFAVWCGGNELIADDYTPLSDAHPALAKLKSVVAELDPDRAWVPTSPSGPEWSTSIEKAGTGRMHDVHGPWKYAGLENHYALYNAIDPLLHSEFGVEGAANLETIHQFFSPEHQWPADSTNPVWVHHASWWLQREMIEQVFGKIDKLETYVRASQWLHAEGLRYGVEAHRRRSGPCSGVLPWQFNEAYPNAVCTNAIDYLLTSKPVYWWVRQAYAPTSVSLRYERLTWKPGEQWSAEVWAVSSAPAEQPYQWRFELYDLSGARLQEAEGQINLSRDKAIMAKRVQQVLPAKAGTVAAFLTLKDSKGGIVAQNEYVFSTQQPAFEAMLNSPEVSLHARTDERLLVIENECDFPALMIRVRGDETSLQQGYFCLPPKGSRAVAAAGTKCTVSAWNAPSIQI
ncbi:MAG: glycoside hydrolase family 2 protein [Candidatus Sumerlaeaceae bacterium]